MNIVDSDLLRTARSRRPFASRNAGKCDVAHATAALCGEGPLRGAAQTLPHQTRFTFGAKRLDDALCREGQAAGLPLAALHEIHAAESDDSSSAAAFALLMAERARMAVVSSHLPLLWARESRTGRQQGLLYPPGLVELGIDPDGLIMVEADDPLSVLRAGADAAHCVSLAAVIIELAGSRPKGWDLTASRRLSLSAQKSGVPVLCLRQNAAPISPMSPMPPIPSAAYSRWTVASAPSTPLEANAPGHPAFDINLQRHRGGLDGLSARLEWNRDQKYFAEQPATKQEPRRKEPPDIGAGHAVSVIGTDRETRYRTG